ncbi:UBP1-associated protein 2B-like [Papaver somniferum]|uniref:UBP1-associated protein 2B-like n=1 Tax=Papaver somniferum TaxID=3469 RepID=UPI000E704BAF|nr:UBP1-associated protein 2B-like [Papaver somniferum]
MANIKDQLINIIRSVSTENTKIIEEIRKLAFQNPSHCRKTTLKASKEPLKKIGNRMTASDSASSDQQQMNVKKYAAESKIFVGNVSSQSEITAEKLHKFFSKFGEMERGPLGFDKDTRKPKGYALFTYKTVEGARKDLEKPTKNFNGHTLHCAISTGGSGSGSNKQKSGSGPNESLTLTNEGCDFAAMAPTNIQPRAASAMKKSAACDNPQGCHLNTSHKIGPSRNAPAKKPALAWPGICIPKPHSTRGAIGKKE